MTRMAELVRLETADEGTLRDINALLKELSQSPEKRECSLELLQMITKSPESELWTVQESGSILGMATLVVVMKPGGITARVEDVVVHENVRGKGFGRMLMEKVIERARARGATMAQLNSRPSRGAANALYQKLGFKKHETNSYYLNL
ncbi:GNAT family N-acetyltransferase [Candidatus Kaiserbacteria bacterium]|nr:GNAT family N-acetyltransferase [Candidatus Kaiserbacteria bacterium]